MELRDFVSQTLVQIVQGVTEAQQEMSKGQASSPAPAIISPQVQTNLNWAAQHGYLETKQGQQAQIVTFDVALTVSSETSGKAGIGVVAGFLHAGGTGSKSAGDTSLSRVQFSVPLILPSDEK